MEIIAIIFAIFGIYYLAERRWPATAMPKVPGWAARAVFINGLQVAIILGTGFFWQEQLGGLSMLNLSEKTDALSGGATAYLFATFVYYWWHRIRHNSYYFWRSLHQIHHSPRRLEAAATYYRHPWEMLINAVIACIIAYSIFGLDLAGAAVFTLFCVAIEMFFHANLKTPHWLGYIIQRPEMHRIHHQLGHHRQNYGDLPIWDILFSTYNNPKSGEVICGFEDNREQQLFRMIAAADINRAGARTFPLWRRWLKLAH